MTKLTRPIGSLFLAVTCLALIAPATADTHTWNGSVGSDWFAANNWTPAGPPAAGDTAVYTNAGTALLLTNETPVLSSFTMKDGTLTCTNWFTRIQSTNVTIEGGTITLPGAFTEADMSNRVWIVASGDFTLGSNAVIDVAGKGYDDGYGEGAGSGGTRTGGGAYGGRGGRGREGAQGGTPYGTEEAPTAPGSGAGTAANSGAGGGAVRIAAEGTVEINGTITAKGQNSGYFRHGGGSGGGVYITCSTFKGGVHGLLNANGGNGGSEGGAGGGGRIAIDYDTLAMPHDLRFSASPGSGSRFYDSRWDFLATMGTVWLPDTGVLSATLQDDLFTDVRLFIGNSTSWTVGSLVVSNCSVTFASSNFQVSVIGETIIGADGVLGIGNLHGDHGGRLFCGGDLSLQDGGDLYVYSGTTNGTVEYGALVSVTGTLDVGTGSWVCPYSHRENGGSTLFQVGELSIAEGGGFNANARGFGPGLGTGRGIQDSRGGGGGYGGHGGAAQGKNHTIGSTYGRSIAPTHPGSGGGAGTYAEHSPGGGLVRIESRNDVVLNGTIMADGGDAFWRTGAGSGGGIFLACEGKFSAGPNSVLQARGGSTGNEGGGGGGGRIAVWYRVPAEGRMAIMNGRNIGQTLANSFDAIGTLSVTNGAGWADYAAAPEPDDYAKPGTIVFVEGPPPGTLFLIR